MKHKRQRKSRAVSKRRRSKLSTKNPLTSLRTGTEFFALREKVRETCIGITNAVSLIRNRHMSRTKAARESGVDARTLKRLGGSALRKIKGRYVAKPDDRLFRLVVVITKKGTQEVATRDSRQASKAGKHSAAVERYLETGDDSALRKLKGKYIVDATGKRVRLLTDLDELQRLASAGVLSFESLYARS
jgi:hypothetical protein